MRKATLVLFVVLLTACSTNPATGKRMFNIVSESQEIAIGEQSHSEIVRQFGVYDEKPELNRLVDRIGHQLAAASERPNLPWQFTVLDTPMVNAMALPGGKIYVTRGMLERINSEDELAGVIGHEIAHVTARHSAQQISKQQLAQFGMVLGAVVAGPQVLQQYGQLAELGLGLLFTRYSRQHETQADLLGTGYMARAHFNPVGAERMLMTLQRLDKNPATGVDRYFMSHPDPAKRVRDVQQKVAELGGMTSSAGFDAPDRNAYVRLLDGVITANSTERTVIRNGMVYDLHHNLVISTPRGWVASADPGVLFAMRPLGRGANSTYFVAQEVDARELQGANAQDAIRVRLQQMGLQFLGSREGRMNSGERFAIDVWQGQTQSGVVGVETTQFMHGDHVAVMMFVSPNVSRTASPLGDVLSRMSVDTRAVRAADPPRIHVATVRQGESWAELARRATGRSADAEAVANLNGFDLSTPPQGGMMVKLPEEVVTE
ncbi:MAG: M48 family metalloprotease [Acidobacteriota bacterium]|nr:M48 family metalloprotease [Acidobacteriota bacterium]